MIIIIIYYKVETCLKQQHIFARKMKQKEKEKESTYYDWNWFFKIYIYLIWNKPLKNIIRRKNRFIQRKKKDNNIDKNVKKWHFPE